MDYDSIDISITVECKSCGEIYKGNQMLDKDQAIKCATYIKPNNEIYSVYGSRFDTNFGTLTHKPNWIKNGVICDSCVSELLELDLIKGYD